MSKTFTTDRGDNLIFCEALQSLTAPIFIALRRRLLSKNWGVLRYLDLDDITDRGIRGIQSATLAEAVAAEDWPTKTMSYDLELAQAYLDEYHALPFAILELHPEDGARLHYIVPDDNGYRADIHEPACGLHVAADVGFMEVVDG